MCNISNELVCCHYKELEICGCLRCKLEKIQDAEQHMTCNPICNIYPYVFPFFLKKNYKHALIA